MADRKIPSIDELNAALGDDRVTYINSDTDEFDEMVEQLMPWDHRVDSDMHDAVAAKLREQAKREAELKRKMGANPVADDYTLTIGELITGETIRAVREGISGRAATIATLQETCARYEARLGEQAHEIERLRGAVRIKERLELDAVAESDELRAELAAIKGDNERFNSLHSDRLQEIAELKAANVEAEKRGMERAEALFGYTNHIDDRCGITTGGYRCVCGLQAAMDAAMETK